MSKYRAYLLINIHNSFITRARGLVWVLWDVLPPLIMLLFWQAVYQQNKTVAGYTFSNMFMYYLIVTFIRAVVFTHPNESLYQQIVSGQLSYQYLLKPVNTILAKLMGELAYKFNRFLYIIPIFFSYLIINPGLFKISLNFFMIIGFILFLFFVTILFFLIKVLIGLSSFWFNEIGWLKDTTDFLLLLFGGTLFPLDFLPSGLKKISFILPFRFEVYLPAQIFLGKINIQDTLISFLLIIFWILTALILVKIIWKKGIKVYSGYGN